MLSEVDRIARLVVKHPRDAFGGPEAIDAQWRDLGFMAAPDFVRAIEEYGRFLELIGQTGAEILTLPKGERVGLDSLYARDASIRVPPRRHPVLDGQAAARGRTRRAGGRLRGMGHPYRRRIEPPGRLEGGDVVWFDDRTVAVGRGYRTNDEGIRQLRALLGTSIDELIVVPLPHWRGPAMSST